jgi:hypothetical protein
MTPMDGHAYLAVRSLAEHFADFIIVTQDTVIFAYKSLLTDVYLLFYHIS